MLFSSAIKYATLVAAVSAAAVPQPRICYDETPELHCYSGENDIPQDVDVDDVTYIAAYLRAYGQQTQIGRLYTMTAADAPGCGEWLLYSRNTAAAYAKKIDMTYDSSVLFEDIANTIDGGTGIIKKAGIYRCQTDGGSFAVQVNATAAAYNTTEYLDAGYQPDGILVKIVANV